MLVNALSLPSMPWEERPAGTSSTLWRYSANPIIDRHATPDFQQHLQQRRRPV